MTVVIKARTFVVLAGLLLVPVLLYAQSATGSATPTGQKTLAATLNVYVFPTAGQDAAQQSQDEGECYNWAVQNAGVDPFALQQQSSQQQQQTAQGQAGR